MQNKQQRGRITQEFVDHQQKRQGDAQGKLASKMTAVRLPTEIHEVVNSVPEKAAWLRQVITEAAMRDLMGEGSKQS
jgi:predicted GNAT superfamily acetyltransferase